MLSKLKYLPWILVIAIVFVLAFMQYRDARNTKSLLGEKAAQLEAANLEIGRAHTQVESEKKVNQEAIADIDGKLQAEIKKNQAMIAIYASLVAQYEAAKSNNIGLVTTIEQLKKATTVAQLPTGQLFYKKSDGTLADVTSLHWTWNDFRLDISGTATPSGLDDKQTIVIKHSIDYKVHMKLKVQVLETKNPAGISQDYAKLYELGPDGKPVGELALQSFEVIEGDALAPTMRWWNPHLDMGFAMGVTSHVASAWIVDIGFSLAAYGKTKDDNTWRFARFGMGMTESQKQAGFSLSFEPVLWNAGKAIPFMSNFYLAPVASYNFNLNAAMVGLGLSVVF